MEQMISSTPETAAKPEESDLEKTKARLRELREQRERAAIEEIAAVLKKYDCGFELDPYVEVNGAPPRVVIRSKK